MTKLPAFAEWQAPWEKSGDEFDTEKAKKLIYDITHDRETEQGKVAKAIAERDEAKKSLAEAQAKVDEAANKDLSEVERLKKELEKAKNVKPEDAEARLENMQLKAAIKAGLDIDMADRLRGKTLEELEADATKLAESFGGKAKPGDEDEAAVDAARRQPRTFNNPADPAVDGGTGVDATPEVISSIARI